MKRHKVRAIIGVVVLLLAVTLLTGYVSPPFAEAEVPLLDFTFEDMWPFFVVLLGLLIGFIYLIRWLLRTVFRIEPPEQTEAEKLAREERQAKIREQQERISKIGEQLERDTREKRR